MSSLGPSLLTVTIFLGTILVAHCLSRRATAEAQTVDSVWKIPPARWMLLLALVNALIYSLICSIFSFGIVVDDVSAMCAIAHRLCVLFYLFCRLFIYGYLIEKIYLVWGSAHGYRRLHSPVYILCVASMIVFFGLAISVLAVRQRHYVDRKTACVVGIRAEYSVPLVAYEIFFGLLLSFLFVIPLWGRLSKSNPELRLIIVRMLIAAAISMMSSSLNFLGLAVTRGLQADWVCTISCYADTVVSTVAMFWAAPSPGREQVGRADNTTTATQLPSTINQVDLLSFGEVESTIKI